MPDDSTKPKKKLVKVPNLGVVAFPGHFDDSQIIAAIRAHKAQSAGQHTRETNPHFAPRTTEQSEHARQLAPAKPLGGPSYDEALQAIGNKLQPQIPAPTPAGKLSAGQSLQDINRLTGSYTTNVLKDAGKMIAGAVDFPVQMTTTVANLFSSDPNVSSQAEGQLLSMHPGAQVADRVKQFQSDWNKSKALAGTNLAGDALGFWLTGKLAHGIDAVPIKDAPTRFNSKPVMSNEMGEVRVGMDSKPSVWLSPKGWDMWMKAFDPQVDPQAVSGMSVRSNRALHEIFKRKNQPSPEWLQVQQLVGKAHESGSNAITMLGREYAPPGSAQANQLNAAFHVLPEEAAHTWQRQFSDQGWIETHLPREAFQRTAAKIPGPAKARLAMDGYDPNNHVQQVVETAAKFIVGDLMGTTPAEADAFLDHYFKEVTDVHGPEAMNELERARAATQQLQEQIHAEHTQRSRTPAGVPSMAARPSTSVSPSPATAVSPTGGTEAVAFKREANLRDPNNWVASGAEQFANSKGRSIHQGHASPVDFRNRDIADAYDAMSHNPNDPKVKASYDAMKHDIDDQWNWAVNKMGIKFEPWKGPEGTQPYANSKEMANDVRNNHHLYFFQGGDMPADHPLAVRDPESGLSANDRLRAVHDLFGHAMKGHQFGPYGEENAWIEHAPMFSPEALPALTTETKGQNSWVNAGRHVRDAQGNIIQSGQPGYTHPKDRPYAQQKAGLLPERFHYRMDSPISFVSSNVFPLDIKSAGIRLGSHTQQAFSNLSNHLANALHTAPIVRNAIGHWEGGAENSTVSHFPHGADLDLLIYHSANMARLGNQYSWAAFMPEVGGSDRMYGFHVDGGTPEKIASVLKENGITDSTIEKTEDGHAVLVASKGTDLEGKVRAVADQLGVKGDVGEFEGRAEFGGNANSREAANAEHLRTIEGLEQRHPEWKRIREAFESRPDYASVSKFTREAREPFLEATHGSRAPELTEIDPSKQGTGPQRGAERSRQQADPDLYVPRSYFQLKGTRGEIPYTQLPQQYKAHLNAENIYDLQADPDGLWKMVPEKYVGPRKLTYLEKLVKDSGYDGVFDPERGVIETFKGTPVEKLAKEGALFKRQKTKTWKDVEPYLTEEERGRYDTKDKQDKIVAAVNAMPSPEEWDAAVKAGISGKLWYERSSRAFDALVESQPDMFRKTDKNKFLNFVAALSPVQPVRQNLLMAVNLWDKWVKAGRPVDVVWKDPKNFSGIASKNSSLYRLLKGRGNAYGVDLPARMNNAIRALQDQPMSGPKVSAFAPNLGADVNKSTNDTWMAIFGNVNPNRIGAPHLYDAISSMVREAGEKNGIPPRQAQAAIWSFIKSLAELSGWGKDRWIPPQEIVKQGLLTPELVNKHAADFADMLANDSEIRDRIQAIGGDLDALDRKLSKYVPERPDEGSEAHVDPRLLNAAQRLEAARTDARVQAHLAAKSDAGSGLFDDSFDPVTFKRENPASLEDLKQEVEQRRNPNKPDLFDTGFVGDASFNPDTDLAFKRESLDDLKKEAEARRPNSPWYLKSEKMIDEKMKGPMTAADVLRMLKNGGIKEDELKWSGLDDFLREKIEDDDLAKVTPEEVKQHLAENAIQIKEVTKGGQKEVKPFKWEPIANPYNKEAWQSVDTENPYQITKLSDHDYSLAGWHGAGIGRYSDFDTAVQAAEEHNKHIGTSESPRYGRYQEPGGQNYRELLLTMPTPEGEPAYRNSQGELVRDSGNAFHTNHWSEPNILAHIRMNDRITPDGKKLLHVEEIQSDWHQKGRKYRYADPNKPFAITGVEGRFGTRAEAEAAAEEHSVPKSFIRDERTDQLPEGVLPDAPFKKDWHEMAIRRVLQYAAENDYDGVSWTGGDKQAARYDLSKQVESIDVTPTDKGWRSVLINLPRDEAIKLKVNSDGIVDPKGSSAEEEFHGKHISDVVGKEVAEKIMGTSASTVLKGNDLKVGGQGMKGFYDKIVPDYMNKFGKKWGAKVGSTRASLDKIASNSVYEYDGPALTQPQISQIYKDIKEGKRQDTSLAEGTNYVNRSPLTQVLTQIAGEMGRGKTYHDAVASVLADNKFLIDNFAKEFGGSARQKTHRAANFQYLPITPEMRQSLTTEGVPLFKRQGPLPKLNYVDPKASYGQNNSAALIGPDDRIVTGKWHEKIAEELGYNGEFWAHDFLDDGGVRIRSNKQEMSVEFGKKDQRTLDRVRDAIRSLRGSRFVVDFTTGGKTTQRWNGDKESVIQNLDDFENGRGIPAAQPHSVAWFRNQPDAAFKRQGTVQTNGGPDTPSSPDKSNEDIFTKIKAEALRRAPTVIVAAGLSNRNHSLEDLKKQASAIRP